MNKQRGFNIIELMVTIAVLGVLMGVGVPGIQGYIYNNRLTTQINSLTISLLHARSEAVKRNQPVLVCVSTDGAQCAAGGGGTLWSAGWVVFVDRNRDGDIDEGIAGTDNCADGSTTDCIISVQAGFEGTNTLTPAASVVDLIGYTGSGAASCNTVGGADILESCPNNTTYFTLCDFRGAVHAKGLAISSTGRASSITKQPNGSALTCP
jgi:type IV fimbrial biogenesis protein FimT